MKWLAPNASLGRHVSAVEDKEKKVISIVSNIMIIIFYYVRRQHKKTYRNK